jgi:signal transduction histidine kinase
LDFPKEKVFDNMTGLAAEIFHTPDVHIRIERRAEYLKISVTDNGPGIPAEKQGHLFERYYRASGDRRQDWNWASISARRSFGSTAGRSA